MTGQPLSPYPWQGLGGAVRDAWRLLADWRYGRRFRKAQARLAATYAPQHAKETR